MPAQLLRRLTALAALTSCALANPLGYRSVEENASLSTDRVLVRDTEEVHAGDLLSIKRIAAIGDSYSAGIGAGYRLGTVVQALNPDSDWACSRYDHSYPYLIHTDERLGDPDSRTLQFESCDGADLDNVINEQIPNLSGNQQVILLSAGGNDAELTNILNQCIFQWAALNSDQVAVAKAAVLADPDYAWLKDFDWDSTGRGCDGQLARTENIIKGVAFSKKLDSVIAAAKRKLGPDGMIYYTGYAKFFAEDLSSDCDSKLHDIFQPEQKLTKAHRQAINGLIDAVNSQISAAVKRAGNKVKFVDYDSYIGLFGSRFCEAGVDESTSESSTRAGLVFYELNAWNSKGNDTWKRCEDHPAEGTLEGTANIFAQITLLMDPDAKFTEQVLAKSTFTESLGPPHAAVLDTAALSDLEVQNILPDGYSRAFHPNILLYQLIASLVIYEMANKNTIDNGYREIPEVLPFDVSPYVPEVGSTTGGGQQIALASYIHPLADPAAWNRIIDYPSDIVSVLIANVLNGPDTTVNEPWADVINRAYASGKRILGYVRTGYLGQSQQRFETRLGSTDLADWVAQIETDVDLWYELYPGKIGGIFFDEAWNNCGPDNQYADLYRFLSDYTKRKHQDAFTVLNPGTAMPQCFENSADTLMTFEQSYDMYMYSYVPNPGWTPADPRKLWHIIYGVSQADAASVAELALERGAGFVHITDDILPNPYDTLPSEAYMSTLMDAVQGGAPDVASPSSFEDDGHAAIPLNALTVTESDYSSVSLKWDISNRHTPYAYAVIRDGIEVARIPGTMDQVTIGNIDPGSSMSFTVRVIGEDGIMTGDSPSVSATTDSLPGNQAVTNIRVTNLATSTTVSADFLVPYAMMRIYLADPDTNCIMPAWPINFNTDHFICAHYMVENEVLYKYSGTEPAQGENYSWTWTSVGAAPATRDRYTWAWTLPVGTETTDSRSFIVQAQGYRPLTNVFHPCPSEWDEDTKTSGAYCTG
ncbi:fibronectin type III domain protein [Aspergillus falconensis]